MRVRVQTCGLGFLLVALAMFSVACENTVEVFNAPPGSVPGPGDDPTLDPEPTLLDINGTWTTTAVESLDTCGFDPPEPVAPMLIQESGTDVLVTTTDSGGVCDETVRSRNENSVSLFLSETLELDGAFVQVDLTIEYLFTDSGFTGTASWRFSDLSGVFTNLPCDYELRISGSRCDGCWTGCTAAKSGELEALPALPWRAGELRRWMGVTP